MRSIFFLLLAFLIIGCSHYSSPTQPGDSTLITVNNQQNTNTSDGKMLWGYFDVTIDPATATIEAVPLRDAAFKANVLVFLQPPLGNPNWVGFSNLDASQFLATGIIELDVSFTHPFPGFDKYRGFDVLGVFMSNASLHYAGDNDAILPKLDGTEAYLVNADGYTRWFNPAEFTAETIFGFKPGIFGTSGFTPTGTVNGYKYFCDGLDPDESLVTFFGNTTSLNFRGSFAPGNVNKRHYVCYFPVGTGAIKYQYAVCASWHLPANPSNPQLSDFPPDANQSEPFLLVSDTSASTVFYENDSSKGGSIHVSLDVYDWDQLLQSQPIIDGIDAVMVSSVTPGFITGVVNGLPSSLVGTGGPAYDTIIFDIDSVNPTHSGTEYLLISVENSDPNSYNQGFGAPASDGALASWIIASVEVLDESPNNQSPSVGAISGDQNTYVNQTDVYTVAAIDPDGDPLHYEWSLVPDGDPVDWGNVGTDSDSVSIEWALYGIGAYDLYARVKDDFNPWVEASNNPYDITVEEINTSCGTGVFGYMNYAYTQHQGIEPAFLSDGTVVIEHGYSFTDREFQLMTIHYEEDVPGYCSDITPDPYDICEDDWCEEYHPVYVSSTDPANIVRFMETDPNGTWGPGTETDDIIAFTNSIQPNIVQFIHNFNNAAHAVATSLANTAVVTGEVIAMDFDAAGNLWILDQNGNVYKLLKASNYPLGNKLFTLDLAAIAPDNTVIFDWAISYLTGDIFIFTGETVGGTIHKVDGTIGMILDSVSNALDAGITNPDYGLGTTGARGDIEIDHRIFDGENPFAENCRLVISGGPGGTGHPVMFSRYDQDLNLLSTWDFNQPGAGDCNNPPSTEGGRWLMFDPVDHANDAWDHTMWVGDAGTGAGNLIWATDGRPVPADWSGN